MTGTAMSAIAEGDDRGDLGWAVGELAVLGNAAGSAVADGFDA